MSLDLDLLRGTLDMMILKALLWGPRHGYDVASWIRSTSREAFQVQEGALYTALHRLEDSEWVESEWGISDNNRRAKYYKLTPAGRAQLRQQVDVWTRYTEAAHRIIHATA